MVGAGAQALYSAVAEAGAQALAQLFSWQRLLWTFLEQHAVFRYEPWQVLSHQPYCQNRRRQLQLLKAPTGQLEEHGGFALGAQQADRYLAVGLIAVLEVKDEALHTAVSPRQIGGQVSGQAAQREEQRLVRLDFEIQLDARLEHIRRPVELQGQRTLAKQRIQLNQHVGRKAFGQAVAGQGEHLRQAAHSHAGERGGNLAGEPGAIHRQLA